MLRQNDVNTPFQRCIIYQAILFNIFEQINNVAVKDTVKNLTISRQFVVAQKWQPSSKPLETLESSSTNFRRIWWYADNIQHFFVISHVFCLFHGANIKDNFDIWEKLKSEHKICSLDILQAVVNCFFRTSEQTHLKPSRKRRKYFSAYEPHSCLQKKEPDHFWWKFKWN